MENSYSLPPDEDEQIRTSPLDALIEIQEAENFLRIVDAEMKAPPERTEAFDSMVDLIPELTSKDLDLCEQELAEAKEIAETEETMEDILTEFLGDLKKKKNK